MKRWNRRGMAGIAGMAAIALAALAGALGVDRGPLVAQAPAESASERAGTSVMDRLRLALQPDEARTVLRILERRAAGARVPEAAWRDLFATEGYRRMMERERAMDEMLGVDRGHSDDAFRAWAQSDAALADLDGRRAGLGAWTAVDLERAGDMALAYLPEFGRIQATIYPLIRKQTNSFVHDLAGDRPAIFMHVAADQTPASLEHVLAHELHHVGLIRACASRPGKDDPVHAILGGFGEGVAVLAAAGGPGRDTHPFADADERERWSARLDSVAADMAEFEAFMDSVFTGRIDPEEAPRRSFRFVTREGVPQGPFYSLGWLMAATIERELGRATLVDGLCCPERLLLDYDVAAEAIADRNPDAAPPRWSAPFLDRLRERVGRD